MHCMQNARKQRMLKYLYYIKSSSQKTCKCRMMVAHPLPRMLPHLLHGIRFPHRGDILVMQIGWSKSWVRYKTPNAVLSIQLDTQGSSPKIDYNQPILKNANFLNNLEPSPVLGSPCPTMVLEIMVIQWWRWAWSATLIWFFKMCI